jgi:GntR family transcriptional regulator
MHIQRPKPLALQISNALRERIQTKTYSPGSQMPTETELMEEFGVSRTTIRIAMASLVHEHLVVRKQGQGTFVSERGFEHNLIYPTPFESFLKVIESSGRKASIQGLGIELRPATEVETESLAIPSESKVFVLSQLYHADDRPAIFVRYLIPAVRVVGSPADSDVNMPIEAFLKKYCNQTPVYNVSYLDKAIALPELIHIFVPVASTPILEFTDLFFNNQDEAIMMSRVFYNQQLIRFHLALTWED